MSSASVLCDLQLGRESQVGSPLDDGQENVAGTCPGRAFPPLFLGVSEKVHMQKDAQPTGLEGALTACDPKNRQGLA